MNRQRIELIGRTVAQPEVQKSKSDKDYSKVRLAVNSSDKNKDGKIEKKVTYYNILFFGKRSEISANLEKGKLVRIVGDLEARPFLSKEGEPKVDLTVFVREFQALDSMVLKSK